MVGLAAESSTERCRLLDDDTQLLNGELADKYVRTGSHRKLVAAQIAYGRDTRRELLLQTRGNDALEVLRR